MIIYTLIGIISLFYALYLSFSIVAALVYRSPKLDSLSPEHSFIVLYPVYKAEQELIANIKYMHDQLSGLNYKIFVLSQDSDPMIDIELEKTADIFHKKSFRDHGGNPYHHALKYASGIIIEESSDINSSVLLLDPDNRMDRRSVLRLLAIRKNGADVSLSKRVSANQENAISLFDGISERINDYMFRRAKNVLHLTPELSGSGMMMDSALFTEAVSRFDGIAPGMDKQLLINMMSVRESLNVIFDEQSVVVDEKTSDEESFNRQRLRWFGNQYFNARKFGFSLIKEGIRNKRIEMIDYAILLWRPPRSFQAVLNVCMIPADLVLIGYDMISVPYFSLAAALMIFSLGLFLKKEGLLGQVIPRLFPVIKTAGRNAVTVIKSQSRSVKGTFIHTRSK